MAAVAGQSWKSEPAARLGRVMPDAEAWAHLPLIEDIRELKAAHGAVVVAHNYQVPLITAGIADFTGDSLAMARFAAQTDADTIVVCGVRCMAETAKLLSPARKVLLPAPEAGCSLAESITAADVRSLRTRYPGVPVVAYVNTTAAVKAEVDVCCTSANAVDIVKSLGSPRVVFLPDRYLASFVAERVACEVIPWPGSCEVQDRFSAEDIYPYRGTGVRVLAHPECPLDVQAAANFVGSTAVVCGTAVGAAIAAAASRRRPVVASRRLEIPVGVEADSRLTRLRERMWYAMGPVRDAVALDAALAATLTERDGMPPEDKLVRLHFELAAAMIFAATTREESRGAHWRSDFPRRDPTRDGPRAVYPRGCRAAGNAA